MSTATVVPSWITAVKAEPGSSHPTNAGTIRRCAVLDIGRNSVSPWTIARTMASKSDMSAPPYCGAPELLLTLVLPAALARGLDLLERVFARVPAVDRHLLLLEVLVDREEVLDLVAQLLRHVVELLERVPGRVGERDAQHLVVDPLVVLHPEQGDRLHVDHAPGEGRLRYEHHRVERVAVLAERLRDEAVVGRIDHRREQEAIELDHVHVVVVLVLVAAPLGDLDEADERIVGHRAALSPELPQPRRAVRFRPDARPQNGHPHARAHARPGGARDGVARRGGLGR